MIDLTHENWHHIQINNRPLAMRVKLNQMILWCNKTIGDGKVLTGKDEYMLAENSIWYCQAWFGFSTFYFKNERDKTLFTLRWV